MSRISIVGAGAFGTALAVQFARSGHEVMLCTRSAEQAAILAKDGENTTRLAGVKFPANLNVTSDLSALSGDALLLAMPAQAIGPFLRENAGTLHASAMVACCKGIDIQTGRGPADLIQDLTDATPAILTGPSFASDIAIGLPTALTLACADEKIGAALQATLATNTLRLYRSTDVKGAQLGGALKNVMAIACGLAIGAGLGKSARAALMTRGFAEMNRFAIPRGAKAQTLAGLSGLGDLALTCTSMQSRNFAFGVGLAQGKTDTAGKTVEGVATAQAVNTLALAEGLDLPITKLVFAVTSGQMPLADAIRALLSRPLKEE